MKYNAPIKYLTFFFHISSHTVNAFHSYLNHLSVCSLKQRRNHDIRAFQTIGNVHAEKEHDAKENQEFLLPIFPLRKNIKFPTERLTLNLYEERYLALSDYILQQEEQNRSSKHPSHYGIFGALYCSGKPQMVKDGISPITPLIEVGDIGTVFSTWQHSERDISGDNDRRRVQLKGIGVDRFRVESILHNGYGGGESLTTVDHSDSSIPLPFILVKATLINDASLSLTSANKIKLETDVYNSVIQDGSKRACLLENLYDKDTTYSTSVMPDILPFYYPATAGSRDSTSNASTCNAQQKIDSMYHAWNPSHKDESSYQDELFSFAMASTLTSIRNSDEMLHLLSSTSTHKRLEYIFKNCNSDSTNNPILNIFNKILNQ